MVTQSWKTTRSEPAPDGAYVEMRYAEFGTGRAKVRSWRLFRDGFQVGYAVNGIDADANYRRVLAGFERNPQTGIYEATPRRVPDSCPMCGMDLKVEGYPLGHQTDEGEVCEFRIALDSYGDPLDGQP
ncbi:hypothetical protein ACWKSP_38695 [Micromonosporaceae bacterium Da 78-11]